MIEAELAQLDDNRVIAQIRSLLVEPKIMRRRWDYGVEETHYPCWTVLSHKSSNTDIAYCEHGFGPSMPWGLVSSEGPTSMGQDCSWFRTFVRAYFDSFAATELPIWRVFQSKGPGERSEPITEEGAWDDIWKQVMALREQYPAHQYDCDTSVRFERE